MPTNSVMGFVLARKIRNWLYEWSLTKVTNVMSPEEAAAIASIASGENNGGLTMDEEDFKEFQRFQSETNTKKKIDPQCNLRDFSTLTATLEAYYAEQNPDKVASAPVLARKNTKTAQKLSSMLAEKYPDAPLLRTYCPSIAPDESDQTDAIPKVDLTPIRPWEREPLPYQAAITAIATCAVLMVAFGAPLARRPALASKVDTLALVVLAGGAFHLDAHAHIVNAVVLAAAGCHLMWVCARQRRTPTSPTSAAPIWQEQRKDWYNY